MRPEANIEADIEAGRVNLAKKNSKDLEEAAVASKKLRRHPSAAEADQIWGFEKCSGFGCLEPN